MTELNAMGIPRIELKMGVYRHYKGERYLVLGLARDANADGGRNEASLWVSHPRATTALQTRTVVVCVQLNPNLGSKFEVRTRDDFTAWLKLNDGQPTTVLEDEWRQYVPEQMHHYGWVQRFAYLGVE